MASEMANVEMSVAARTTELDQIIADMNELSTLMQSVAMDILAQDMLISALNDNIAWAGPRYRYPEFAEAAPPSKSGPARFWDAFIRGAISMAQTAFRTTTPAASTTASASTAAPSGGIRQAPSSGVSLRQAPSGVQGTVTRLADLQDVLGFWPATLPADLAAQLAADLAAAGRPVAAGTASTALVVAWLELQLDAPEAAVSAYVKEQIACMLALAQRAST